MDKSTIPQLPIFRYAIQAAPRFGTQTTVTSLQEFPWRGARPIPTDLKADSWEAARPWCVPGSEFIMTASTTCKAWKFLNWAWASRKRWLLRLRPATSTASAPQGRAATLQRQTSERLDSAWELTEAFRCRQCRRSKTPLF